MTGRDHERGAERREEVEKTKKSDAQEFWDDIGVDLESLSPKG
jgi:hypothetical protein